MWQIKNSSLPLKAGFITVRKAALFKVKLSVHGGAASWLSGPSLSDGSVLRCLISRLLGDSFRRLSTWRNTEASLYLRRRPKTSCPENSHTFKISHSDEYYFCQFRLILRHLLHPCELLGNSYWKYKWRIWRNKSNLLPLRKPQDLASALFPAEEHRDLRQTPNPLSSRHQFVPVWHGTAHLGPPVKPAKWDRVWCL